MSTQQNPSVFLPRVFFYGTFMSAAVLRAFGIDVQTTIPARVEGFALTVRPRVNLIPCRGATSYGSVANISHAEINSLYQGLQDDFGITYHPYPVLAQELKMGADVENYPALLYLSDNIPDANPDPGYIKELAQCAQDCGAPDSYIRHIHSFAAIPSPRDNN